MTTVLSDNPGSKEQITDFTIRRGFTNPVFDSQRIFRTVMDAMARPGILHEIDNERLAPPTPLSATLAGIVMTLCDYDTPLWLDTTLSKSSDVISYLKFHTGAPIVDLPKDAAFAVVSSPQTMIPPGNFNTGSPEYPDRSTTLIIGTESLSNRTGVYLTGPGIKQQQSFGVRSLPEYFWPEMIANHALFPLGIDVVFAGEQQIAALPRSTSIRQRED